MWTERYRARIAEALELCRGKYRIRDNVTQWWQSGSKLGGKLQVGIIYNNGVSLRSYSAPAFILLPRSVTCFGHKDPPALLKVVNWNWKTYKGWVSTPELSARTSPALYLWTNLLLICMAIWKCSLWEYCFPTKFNAKCVFNLCRHDLKHCSSATRQNHLNRAGIIFWLLTSEQVRKVPPNTMDNHTAILKRKPTTINLAAVHKH